jgi:phosphoribosylcarboxyaminoimidazole (NCAIR) mutase
LDSLLSIVQMPPGIPVAYSGERAKNAALYAAAILALKHDNVEGPHVQRDAIRVTISRDQVRRDPEHVEAENLTTPRGSLPPGRIKPVFEDV